MPDSQRNLTQMLQLKFPHVVGEYDTYEAAQAAVDFLSDKAFPVENLAIVGSDLKLVERVLGRRTWSTVLGQGAISGIGTGLLVGLMMSLFFSQSGNIFAYLVLGLALGIIIGMLTSAIAYGASRGKRDFNSISQTVANKYQVLAEHQVANQARELLLQMPNARAALFE